MVFYGQELPGLMIQNVCFPLQGKGRSQACSQSLAQVNGWAVMLCIHRSGDPYGRSRIGEGWTFGACEFELCVRLGGDLSLELEFESLWDKFEMKRRWDGNHQCV